MLLVSMIIHKISMQRQVFARSGEQGFIVLTVVLVILVIGVVFTTSMVLLGVNSSRSNVVLEQSQRARGLADACAEEALQQIQDSVAYEGSSGLSLGQGSCTYTVVKQIGQNRTVEASGVVGSVSRRVSVELDAITPSINITSWQEVSSF